MLDIFRIGLTLLIIKSDKTSPALEVKINLSTQKNIEPPIRFAAIVNSIPDPIFLTANYGIGVLNCHLIKYNINLLLNTFPLNYTNYSFN